MKNYLAVSAVLLIAGVAVAADECPKLGGSYHSCVTTPSNSEIKITSIEIVQAVNPDGLVSYQISEASDDNLGPMTSYITDGIERQTGPEDDTFGIRVLTTATCSAQKLMASQRISAFGMDTQATSQSSLSADGTLTIEGTATIQGETQSYKTTCTKL
jgi:hypothetical protein